MATDPTPWFVGGGAEHSPEVARLLAYASTAGSEGIIDPSSLRVSAQAVPGPSVRVFPGAGLILNRYAGGGQQTYALRNPTSTTVAIPATGSSGGRTDVIVARILDPQYEGQPPADPLTFQYARLERINGVPANTKTAKQLNLGYPAIALARVTIPASTGTITAGMITDLRSVANPKVETVLRPRATITAGEESLVATRANGEWFPNAGGEQQIDIPEWATRAQISAEWIMIQEGVGNAFGDCWVEFGPGAGGTGGTQDREFATQRYRWNSANTSDTKSNTWKCSDDVYIPAALRGTTQTFVMKARLSTTYPVATRPRITNMSGTELLVRFLQVADPSDS